MNALPAISYKCKSCARAISRSEAKLFGAWLGTDFSGRLCVACRLAQREQLPQLEIAINSDGRGHSCDGCHDDLATIAARQNGTREMYCHWKDGVFQFLCWRCSAHYEQSNRLLYADTYWGWLHRLK